MALWGKEILGINHAVTQFHYTERYRYTTTITTYKVRGYMVVNKINPVRCGTVYKTKAEAEQGLQDLQDWLRRSLRNREADMLIVIPYDTEESTVKRRAYKIK